mgnify:CR=1 FL=1
MKSKLPGGFSVRKIPVRAKHGNGIRREKGTLVPEPGDYLKNRGGAFCQRSRYIALWRFSAEQGGGQSKNILNARVMPLAKELRLEEYSGYILSFNGGRIINCKTGETVFARSLPVSANKKIIGLAEEHQVDIATYEGSRIISSNPESPYAKLESRINGMELWKPENMKEYVNFEVPKFLMMEDGDYLAMVEPKVKAAMGKNFSVYRSDPFFLEVLPKGIDKAQSLERLLEVLGLTREQMIACGDGYNDLTMIRYAGLGVAMENAVLPVRNAADYITASNNDDGVGLVVEKFMLA